MITIRTLQKYFRVKQGLFGTPRQVRVEIRGGSGKLEAVVGERLTTGG